jgi:hypothetical protein
MRISVRSSLILLIVVFTFVSGCSSKKSIERYAKNKQWDQIQKYIVKNISKNEHRDNVIYAFQQLILNAPPDYKSAVEDSILSKKFGYPMNDLLYRDILSLYKNEKIPFRSSYKLYLKWLSKGGADKSAESEILSDNYGTFSKEIDSSMYENLADYISIMRSLTNYTRINKVYKDGDDVSIVGTTKKRWIGDAGHWSVKDPRFQCLYPNKLMDCPGRPGVNDDYVYSIQETSNSEDVDITNDLIGKLAIIKGSYRINFGGGSGFSIDIITSSKPIIVYPYTQDLLKSLNSISLLNFKVYNTKYDSIKKIVVENDSLLNTITHFPDGLGKPYRPNYKDYVTSYQEPDYGGTFYLGSGAVISSDDKSVTVFDEIYEKYYIVKDASLNSSGQQYVRGYVQPYLAPMSMKPYFEPSLIGRNFKQVEVLKLSDVATYKDDKEAFEQKKKDSYAEYLKELEKSKDSYATDLRKYESDLKQYVIDKRIYDDFYNMLPKLLKKIRENTSILQTLLQNTLNKDTDK